LTRGSHNVVDLQTSSVRLRFQISTKPVQVGKLAALKRVTVEDFARLIPKGPRPPRFILESSTARHAFQRRRGLGTSGRARARSRALGGRPRRTRSRSHPIHWAVPRWSSARRASGCSSLDSQLFGSVVAGYLGASALRFYAPQVRKASCFAAWVTKNALPTVIMDHRSGPGFGSIQRIGPTGSRRTVLGRKVQTSLCLPTLKNRHFFCPTDPLWPTKSSSWC